MDPILEQKLASLGEHIKQRTRERQAQAQAQTLEVPATALVIPFPHLWAEAVRACPLAMLRSALFGVVRRGRRQYLNDVEIAAWPGASIRYKGEQLDQADLDVWMQAVHLFRQQGLGGRLHLSAYEFLKAIERCTGKHDYQWLERSFTRMIACAVKIDTGRYRYAGNLVHEFWWLLGYVSTHQATVLKPHRIGLDKLQRLCGAGMRDKDFKYWIRRYMDQLKDLDAVTAWHFTGTDDDILEFIRPLQKASRKSQRKR